MNTTATETAMPSQPADTSSTTETGKKYHGFQDGPKPLTGLYRWAGWGLRAYMVAELALFAISLFLIWLYLPSTVVPFSNDQLGAIDIGIVAVGLAQLVLFWVCVILVGRVTYRAMKNLHTMHSTFPDMSPGWAVGWYFIPIANLFQPARGMSQIYHGTFAAVGEPVPSQSRIGIWWTCWLLTNFTANIAFRLAGGWETDTFGIESFSFDAASALFGALAAWSLMRLLRPISIKQDLFKHGGVAQVFD